MNPVDITSQVYEICDLLGLEPTNVRRLVVEPFTVEATTYVLNGEGKHHLDEHGEPALGIRVYTVQTYHPT